MSALSRRALLAGISSLTAFAAEAAPGARIRFGRASPPAGGDLVTDLAQHNTGVSYQSPRERGTFLAGDYWTLGGAGNAVSIIATSPAFAAGVAGSVINPTGSFTGRALHGLQVNPGNRAQNAAGTVEANFWGVAQGFDSYVKDNLPYDAALNLDPAKTLAPLVLEEGAVVKARSAVTPQSSARPTLDDIAVYTIVRTRPAANQFRPPVAMADKEYFKLHETDIDYSFLPSLPLPAGATAPLLSDMIAKTRRPWQVGSTNNLQSRNINAANNQAEYGATISYSVGDALMSLCLDYPLDQKKPLLWNCLQIGLDIVGRVKEGGVWAGIGGGNAWAKPFVVLCAKAFASTAYGPELRAIASAVVNPRTFAEDSQLVRIDPSFLDSPRDNSNVVRPREAYLPYMVGDIEWSVDWEVNNAAGSNKEVVYRPIICPTWIPFALACDLMGMWDIWASPDFREYCDKYWSWFRLDATGYPNAITPFHHAMRTAYRGASGLNDLTWRSASADGIYVWAVNASQLDMSGTPPAPSDVTVLVNGSPRTVVTAGVYGSRVFATVSPAVANGDAVSISLAAGKVKSAGLVNAGALSAMVATNKTGVLPPTGTAQLVDNGGSAYITSSKPQAPVLAIGTAKRFMFALHFDPEVLGVNQNALANQTGGTLRWYMVNNTSWAFTVSAPSICRLRPSTVATTGPQTHVAMVDFTKTAAADGAKYGVNGVVATQSGTAFDSLGGTRSIDLSLLFSGGIGVLAASLGGNVLNGKAGYLLMHYDEGEGEWPTFDAALLANAAPLAIGGRGENLLGIRPKFYWPFNKDELNSGAGIENRGTGGYRKLFAKGEFT